MANQDQEFVEYVVRAIVDNPDKVKTNRRVDEMGVLIELEVAPDDMGKIIGKEGKTAKSVRTLLRVLGAKNNARVNLKIIEPEGFERPAPAAGQTKPATSPMPANQDSDQAAGKATPIEEEKTTEVV